MTASEHFLNPQLKDTYERTKRLNKTEDLRFLELTRNWTIDQALRLIYFYFQQMENKTTTHGNQLLNVHRTGMFDRTALLKEMFQYAKRRGAQGILFSLIESGKPTLKFDPLTEWRQHLDNSGTANTTLKDAQIWRDDKTGQFRAVIVCPYCSTLQVANTRENGQVIEMQSCVVCAQQATFELESTTVLPGAKKDTELIAKKRNSLEADASSIKNVFDMGRPFVEIAEQMSQIEVQLWCTRALIQAVRRGYIDASVIPAYPVEFFSPNRSDSMMRDAVFFFSQVVPNYQDCTQLLLDTQHSKNASIEDNAFEKNPNIFLVGCESCGDIFPHDFSLHNATPGSGEKAADIVCACGSKNIIDYRVPQSKSVSEQLLEGKDIKTILITNYTYREIDYLWWMFINTLDLKGHIANTLENFQSSKDLNILVPAMVDYLQRRRYKELFVFFVAQQFNNLYATEGISFNVKCEFCGTVVTTHYQADGKLAESTCPSCASVEFIHFNPLTIDKSKDKRPEEIVIGDSEQVRLPKFDQQQAKQEFEAFLQQLTGADVSWKLAYLLNTRPLPIQRIFDSQQDLMGLLNNHSMGRTKDHRLSLVRDIINRGLVTEVLWAIFKFVPAHLAHKVRNIQSDFSDMTLDSAPQQSFEKAEILRAIYYLLPNEYQDCLDELQGARYDAVKQTIDRWAARLSEKVSAKRIKAVTELT